MAGRRRRAELLIGASVPAIVRHAHNGARLARWGGAVLLGAGGLGLTLAAGELSSGGVNRVETWVVAAFVGVLVSASWLITTHKSTRETASALDRRLGFGGALLTAFESQENARAGELVDLLAAKVAARLSPSEALRAARPLTAFPIVSPFLAAAALALAMEATRPQADALPFVEMARAMSDKIALARGASLDALEAGKSAELGQQPTELPARLTELLSSAGKQETEWRRSPPAPADALESIESLERKLEEVVSELPTSNPLSNELRDLSNLLDAAALRARDVESADRRGETWRKAGKEPLASTGPSGRIDEPESLRASTFGQPSVPTASSFQSRERAAGVANDWRPEYDEIVARWVEHIRVVERQ